MEIRHLTILIRTGYGQHGDYVFGWKDDTLQKAMDSGCYLRNCSVLSAQEPKKKNLCQVPVTVDEDVDGCKFKLMKMWERGLLTICRDG